MNLAAHSKIIIAMFIVGSSVVAGKIVIDYFPIFLASELRFMVATIILFPLLIKLEGIPSIRKKDLLILFLQSFFGVFLFSLLMLYGLKLTTAIEGGIITSTIPAITGVLAFLFLKERITRNIGIGICLAVLGALAINASGSFSTTVRGSFPLLGNVLIFGAVICEALFIVLGKFVSDRVSPLAISTIVSGVGVLLFLPFSIYEASSFHFEKVTFAEWGLILYLGVVVTVVAFILMYQGISQVSANTAGVLTSVLPISSVILAVFLLGEKINLAHIIGMGCIWIAIYFIAKQPNSCPS